MKKLYKSILLGSFVCFALPSFSQELEQKIYPFEPSLASHFGSAHYLNKGIELSGQTLIVADQNAYLRFNNDCKPGRGAVTIYKKNGNQWTFSQRLTSPMQDSINFGKAIALHGNILAVMSHREPSATWEPVGAIYVYRRSDPGANFELKQKIQSPEPFLQNFRTFHSVAINDNYLAASVANSNEIHVYKILADTLLHHYTFQGMGYSPAKICLTDNNMIIGASNGIFHFKINEDNVMPTYDIHSAGYTEYIDVAVDGNMVVHQSETARSNNSTSFEFLRIGDDGSRQPVFSISLQYTSANGIEFKDGWFFARTRRDSLGTILPPTQIQSFKLTDNYYKRGAVIEAPDGATEAFGQKLDFSDGLLAVGDLYDSSNTNNNVEGCHPKAGKGAVYVYAISDIVTGNKAFHENAGSLISPNPYTGQTLHLGLSDVTSVEVMDVTGTILRKIYPTGDECHLSGLAKGVYMVKLTTKGYHHTKRLVVE